MNYDGSGDAKVDGMMQNLDGCQIPLLPQLAEGPAPMPPQPFKLRFKRTFAKAWNYQVKPRLKKIYKWWDGKFAEKVPAAAVAPLPIPELKAGDRVRVRSKEEILASLNRFKELKGNAFLDNMWQYCGQEFRVLKVMERFLDERDYKVKKVRNLILLENVICHGTTVFGQCDRCCHLFWRAEWLEKLEAKQTD
jgi:hypothetical protein